MRPHGCQIGCADHRVRTSVLASAGVGTRWMRLRLEKSVKVRDPKGVSVTLTRSTADVD